jgi:hypothetical protein
MDDMVDLGRDTRRARHNYVTALIYHDADKDMWEQLLEKAAAEPEEQDRATLLLDFPLALGASARLAQTYLFDGLSALFAHHHQYAVQPAIAFLYGRIGTEHLMAAAGLSA